MFVIDLQEEPETIVDSEASDDDYEVHKVDLTPAFAFPRKILRWIGLWHEEEPETTYKKYIEFIQSVFYKLTNVVLSHLILQYLIDFIVNFNDSSINSKLINVAYVIRLLAGLYILSALNNVKGKVNKLIAEIFSKIEVPNQLASFFEHFQQTCANINKILHIIQIIVFIIVIPSISFLLISKYFKYENNEVQLVKTDLYFYKYFDQYPTFVYFLIFVGGLALAPIVILTLGFNIFYISLATLTVKMLKHIVQVLNTLDSGDVTQEQVAVTLKYVRQLQTRTISLVDGINAIYSLMKFFDTISAVYMIYAFGFLNILQGFRGELMTIARFVAASLIFIFTAIMCCVADDIKHLSNGGIQDVLNKSPRWAWNEENISSSYRILLTSYVSRYLKAGPCIKLSKKTLLVLVVLVSSGSAVSFMFQDAMK